MSETLATTALVTYTPPEVDKGDIYADPLAFGHWQRVAKLFAESALIPEHLRGKVADVTIGIALSRRLRIDPLLVLQNLYVVKGTPGWKTSFLVALANAAGWDLDWEVQPLQPERMKWKRKTREGEVQVEAPNLRVRVTMRRGGLVKVGMWVSLEQAIAAKWADNEQYVHSTELMLGWRAAAFAIRRFDPNLLLGLYTVEELRGGSDPDLELEALPLVAAIESAPPSVPVGSVTPSSGPSGGAPSSSPPSASGASGVSREPSGGDPDREAALARLRAAEARVDSATRDAVRRQHELRSIRPQTTTARILALAEAMEGAAVPAEVEDEERADLLAQLTTMAADIPENTRRSLREQHHVTDLRALPLDRLRTFVAASRAALAAHLQATEWTDPGSPIEPALTNDVADWELKYSDAGREVEVAEYAERAGLPIRDGFAHLDGAPDSMKRRYLHEMSSAWERS